MDRMLLLGSSCLILLLLVLRLLCILHLIPLIIPGRMRLLRYSARVLSCCFLSNRFPCH